MVTVVTVRAKHGLRQLLKQVLGRKARMITRVGRWTVEHEPSVTACCYAGLPIGAGCTCTDCENFMAALDVAFPPQFRALTETFGVDVRKPAELVHYWRDESGAHRVGGWFHIVGHICSGSDGWKASGESGWVPDFESYASGMKLGFTERLALVPETFGGQNVLQLQFETRVPWVLSTPESV
jgi:hypothetical protein